MTLRKPWKVVGGTLAAAVALGSTAAVAQTGNDLPDSIDLDDVVTIDEVTNATIASLFSDSPTSTLDESIASVSDDADDTSADDKKLFGYFGKRQRSRRGNDSLLVNIDAGQLRHFRPRRNNDMLCLKNLLLAIDERDLHAAGTEYAASPMEMVRLVLAQQKCHAGHVAFYTLVLERHHLGQVELCFDLDAHVIERMLGLFIAL